MTTILTEDEFIDRFRPEQLPDGSYYRHRFWYEPEDQAAIALATTERRIWTQLAEGSWSIENGLHIVGREAYIITEVPVPDGAEFEVVDDPHT